jgi:hypothetical protein
MMEDGKDGILEYGNDGVIKDRNIGVGGLMDAPYPPGTRTRRWFEKGSKRVDRIGEFL